MTGLRRRRGLIYLALFLSGAVALVFQVVWQRYLSFLVGSEARSISLVVAVFLLGLAAGYRSWGNLTERSFSRRQLLKVVGYIELGIALYALVFPRWFEVVTSVSYAGPDWLVVDFLITAALVLLPTFGMGASIPLLTAVVPDTVDEVNYCHSRVYGINTLGAFAGAMLGGFYLVPTFGLPVTLAIGAAANVLVGLYFVANALGGPSHKAEDVPAIPHRFGVAGVYLFVFTTGAISIAYEILFMRILGLSVGSGHYIFPTVVGVVILGLAIGSLSLRRGKITADRVMTEILWLCGVLAVVYLTVPFWPYWASNLRVSLTTIPSNYGVFLTLVVLFVAVMLLPVVIPMGRLLPIGYSLIDKTRSDYGKVCGRVYFVNTLGTVVGAVGLAYVLFLVLDLEAIFKVNLAIMLGLAAFLYWRHGRPLRSVTCALLAAGVFALPQWDRQLHYLGMFRVPSVEAFHFQGLFSMPKFTNPSHVIFFRDDPGASVAVHRGPWGAPGGANAATYMAIVVNGKPDGNTIVDYSNMALTGVLPYLFAPREQALEVAVVGLGTGITSGALAAAPDVASVTTLEISPAVIEAVDRRGLFDEANFGLSTNPKSRVVEMDAFRHLARTRQRYDLVVSEPSNPWVVGVDNLFTPEYYRLVSRVLGEDGALFQWVQLYEMTEQVFSAILDNVVSEFGHVTLYLIGRGDVGILASHQPLQGPHLDRRWRQDHVRRVLYPVGLEPDGPLHLLELFRAPQLRAIAEQHPYPAHTLDFPWLGHAAGRARFLNQRVRLDRLLPPDRARHSAWPAERRERFEPWLEEHAEEWLERCSPAAGRHSVRFLCTRVQQLEGYRRELDRPFAQSRIPQRLEAFRALRDGGFLGPELTHLDEVRDSLLEGPMLVEDPLSEIPVSPPGLDRRVILELLREYVIEGRGAEAGALAAQLHRLDRLPRRDAENLHRLLEIDEIAGEPPADHWSIPHVGQ